jgi:hypothetical protein
MPFHWWVLSSCSCRAACRDDDGEPRGAAFSISHGQHLWHLLSEWRQPGQQWAQEMRSGGIMIHILPPMLWLCRFMVFHTTISVRTNTNDSLWQRFAEDAPSWLECCVPVESRPASNGCGIHCCRFLLAGGFRLGWLSKNGGRLCCPSQPSTYLVLTPQGGPDGRCYFDLTGSKTLGWIPAVSGQRAAQAWTAGTGRW